MGIRKRGRKKTKNPTGFTSVPFPELKKLPEITLRQKETVQAFSSA